MNDQTDDLIDEQLRQAFTPPPAEHYVDVARGVSRPVRRLWPWVLALAAALLVIAMVWDGRSHTRGLAGPEGHDGVQLAAMWVTAYDHAIDTGFGIGGCCEAPLDLQAKCRELCGAALSFGGNEDLELLGCYCGGKPTGGCLGLLLQVHGEPVSVFVVPRDRDPGPVLDARSDLILQRRELGSIVLYSLAYENREALAGFSL